MRLSTTILLLTAALAAWGVWHWVRAADEGRQVPAVGQPLVRFATDEVSEIQLRRAGEAANLNPIRKTWYLTQPIFDRMDPAAALALYFGLNGLQLRQSIPAAEWRAAGHDLETYGLGREAVRVRLLGRDKATLHDFRLGHLTPWKSGSDNTMYVQWKDGGAPDDILVVAGNLRLLLDRPFDLLRAREALHLPRPPLRLLLLAGNQRLELARAGAGAPWRITRPLADRADGAAVEDFLKKLSAAEALSLSPRDETVFPADEAVRLAVLMETNGAEAEVAAADYAALAAGSPMPFRPSPDLLVGAFSVPAAPPGEPPPPLLARFNDRPFDLHLPRGLLDLLVPDPLPFRARTLADLDPQHLARIVIRANDALREPVVLERQADGWKVLLRGGWARADAGRVRQAIQALNSTPVLGFPTDSLVDPAPYGLAEPVLEAEFTGSGGAPQRLRLGLADGRAFAWFADRPSVYEVPPGSQAPLPANPGAWRSRLLLDFAAADLRQLAVAPAAAPETVLRYNPEENLWTAVVGGENLTDRLDPVAAANFAAVLERLRAARWLAEGIAPALTRLAQPDLVLRLTIEARLDESFDTELRRYRLSFARANDGSPYSYGRINEEPDVFLVKTALVEAIGSDFFPADMPPADIPPAAE
jgi:hypothetical protein